MANVKRI